MNVDRVRRDKETILERKKYRERDSNRNMQSAEKKKEQVRETEREGERDKKRI